MVSHGTDEAAIRTDAARALHFEVRETLRSVGLPTGTLRIDAPLKPRPAAPERPVTAPHLSHDLDHYTVDEPIKATRAAKTTAPTTERPGELIGREINYNRFQNHADRAFGDGVA